MRSDVNTCKVSTRHHRRLLFRLCALLLGALPLSGHATLLDLQIDGVVTEVTASVAGEFAIGESMSIVYTFDTATVAPPSLIPNRMLYPGAITAASYTIDDYSGNALGGSINTSNDDPTLYDTVTFRAGGLTSADIGTRIPVDFIVRFKDATQAALSSLALPTATADLAGFSDVTWQLLFSPLSLQGFPPVAAVGGRVTSAEISTHPGEIPSPTVPALMLSAIPALALRRIRRRPHIDRH